MVKKELSYQQEIVKNRKYYLKRFISRNTWWNIKEGADLFSRENTMYRLLKGLKIPRKDFFLLWNEKYDGVIGTRRVKGERWRKKKHTLSDIRKCVELAGEELGKIHNVPLPKGLKYLGDARLQTMKHLFPISEEIVEDEEKLVLLHGDYHPGNILYDKKKRRVILRAVIDFEEAAYGDPRWDVAYYSRCLMLSSLTREEKLNLVDLFLSSYYIESGRDYNRKGLQRWIELIEKRNSYVNENLPKGWTKFKEEKILL